MFFNNSDSVAENCLLSEAKQFHHLYIKHQHKIVMLSFANKSDALKYNLK